MSLIRKHRAVLQAWACLALVLTRVHVLLNYSYLFWVHFLLGYGVYIYIDYQWSSCYMRLFKITVLRTARVWFVTGVILPLEEAMFALESRRQLYVDCVHSGRSRPHRVPLGRPAASAVPCTANKTYQIHLHLTLLKIVWFIIIILGEKVTCTSHQFSQS